MSPTTLMPVCLSRDSLMVTLRIKRVDRRGFGSVIDPYLVLAKGRKGSADRYLSSSIIWMHGHMMIGFKGPHFLLLVCTGVIRRYEQASNSCQAGRCRAPFLLLCAG